MGWDPVRGNSATALAATGNVASLARTNIVQSGGLLLQLSEESGTNNSSGNEAERRQRNSQSQTVGSTVIAGRDISGFMNVFVVRGCVNTRFNPAGGR